MKQRVEFEWTEMEQLQSQFADRSQPSSFKTHSSASSNVPTNVNSCKCLIARRRNRTKNITHFHHGYSTLKVDIHVAFPTFALQLITMYLQNYSFSWLNTHIDQNCKLFKCSYNWALMQDTTMILYESLVDEGSPYGGREGPRILLS